MALTDLTCKTTLPAPKAKKLSDGGGLYLEVMPNGSKYWRLKYRFLGKEKRLAFGVYPATTLAEARDCRANAQKLLKQGIDPSQDKKDRKRLHMLEGENTFKVIACEWHQHQLEKWTPSHAISIMRRMERDLFPLLGHLPIQQINAQRLLDTIRQIEKRGAYELARRALQTCGQVFRYGVVTGRADRDPSTDLKGALKPFKRGHYSALDAKDIPEFLKTLRSNDARLFLQTRLAIELLLLTFVRTNELIKATWSEFDIPNVTWTIPGKRMKMRKDHIVPLAYASLEILAQLKALNDQSDWVFPSISNPNSHMSNNTILKALERMGYKGKTTGHGFRALAMSTLKEKLGYRHEIIDRQLAHGHKSQIVAAYDRAQFLDERRVMMQKWADYLKSQA